MSRTQTNKPSETIADLAARIGDCQCAVATVVAHLYAGMDEPALTAGNAAGCLSVIARELGQLREEVYRLNEPMLHAVARQG